MEVDVNKLSQLDRIEYLLKKQSIPKPSYNTTINLALFFFYAILGMIAYDLVIFKLYGHFIFIPRTVQLIANTAVFAFLFVFGLDAISHALYVKRIKILNSEFFEIKSKKAVNGNKVPIKTKK